MGLDRSHQGSSECRRQRAAILQRMLDGFGRVIFLQVAVCQVVMLDLLEMHAFMRFGALRSQYNPRTSVRHALPQQAEHGDGNEHADHADESTVIGRPIVHLIRGDLAAIGRPGLSQLSAGRHARGALRLE